MLGTWTATAKPPLGSVLGAGKGRTWTGPMARELTVEKAGKFVPAAVINPPTEPRAGIASADGPGTVWAAVVEAGLSRTRAVTVFVEGMLAVTGTVKVVVKAPVLSAVTRPKAVPA
jgi:hypothetical protein